MNLRTKLIVLFVILTLVPTVVVGMVVLENIKEGTTKEKLNELDTIASLQEATLNNELLHNSELLTAHTARLQTVIELDRYNTEKDRDSQAYLNTVAALAKSEVQRFKGVYILDLDGQVVASTEPEEIGASWANEDYFKIGKERTDVTHIEQDKDKSLSLYLATPLIYNKTLIGRLSARTDSTDVLLRVVPNNSLSTVDIQQLGARNIGVLIIKTDMSGIFDVIEIQKKIEIGTKTFFFSKEENGAVIFMTPTSYNEATELLNIIDTKGGQNSLPSSGYISLGGKGPDSKFATVRYIKGTDWGIIVTASKETTFAEIEKAKKAMIVIGAALIFYAVIVATIVANMVQKEEKQREKSPEEELSEVFKI